MKDIVKRFYGKYYDNDDVKVFVMSGDITTDDYKEITGEDYVK